MPPSYQQNKVHIYNWREKNIEKHKELSRLHMKKYCQWKKIQREFLGILRRFFEED